MMHSQKPKVKAPDPLLIGDTTNILQRYHLTTVCEESACPNRSECYARHTTTFMILGDTCTRACRFCNVNTGRGETPDESEPERIAMAVEALHLSYVVITSVDRDDLHDFGALQFVKTVNAIKTKMPHLKVELLTPDFKGDVKAFTSIIACGADKLAHNVETVRRLSSAIRPQSDYIRSLEVLRYYATHFKGTVKSSLMVGLGEEEAEVLQTMQDILNTGASELTLGQYLQPTPKHHPVVHYYTPQWFEKMKEKAYAMGFKAVASGVLVRSSYRAEFL